MRSLSVTLPYSGGQRALSVMTLPDKGSGQILKSQKQPSTADFKGLGWPAGFPQNPPQNLTFKLQSEVLQWLWRPKFHLQVSPESCLCPGNSTHIPTPLPKWGWIHAGFASEEGESLGESNFTSPHHCPATLSTNHQQPSAWQGKHETALGKILAEEGNVGSAIYKWSLESASVITL